MDTNAKMIDALATAVLANVRDYDITCEVSRRGLSLDITTLTDEQLKDEMLKRELVTDEPQKALAKMAEMFEADNFDHDWPEIARLLRAIPDEPILERVETLDSNSLDEMIDTLCYNGSIDLGKHFDDDALWEAINDQDGIIENAIADADDAELWSAITYKEDIIRQHLDEVDDDVLWDAIMDKEAAAASAMADYVSTCTPAHLAELLKKIAERVASEMAA